MCISTQRKIFIFPKPNVTDVESIRKYIVDPASVEEWPATVDVEANYLVDSCVPRMQLGLGVLEFEVSCSQTDTCKGQAASPGIPAIANGPGSAASAGPGQDQLSRSGSAASEASGQSPPAKRRCLEREDSKPDQSAAEEIAVMTKKAFEERKLISCEESDATTANFWIKAMTCHVLSALRKFNGDKAEFVNTLDEYAAQYFRFVCVRLLEVSDIQAAKTLG